MQIALAILLTIITVGDQWEMTFQPHQDNVAAVIVTECDPPKPFFAYNRVDIDGRDVRASMRKVPTPDGASCRVIGQVIRNDGDDPSREYVGETVIMSGV